VFFLLKAKKYMSHPGVGFAFCWKSEIY